MICEYCKKEYDIKWGSGRFCSRSCANGYASSKITKEKIKQIIEKRNITIRNKTAEKIKEYNSTNHYCKKCGKLYIDNWSKSGKSEFCSSTCARSYSALVNREQRNKKISETLKNRQSIRNNTNKTLHRDIVQYAETHYR